MKWLRRAAGADDAAARRWIVLDVETTGLDVAHDRLLALAAVALHWDPGAAGAAPRIAIGDSFEVMLRQPQPTLDRANILLHGIGVGAQAGGVDARPALDAFARWAGAAPWIGFHVAFDEAVIRRARREAGTDAPATRGLDLAALAAVLCPEAGERTLDAWMARFGIRCARRHQAAADALATAELLLALWPRARMHTSALPAERFRALRRLAAQRRWLP